MPKNKGKGGKNRRRGKNDSDEKRVLLTKQEEQEYGQVLRMLGNCQAEVKCLDGPTRLCHIRGKLRKRVWVNVGDIVLVSLRDFQDSKADIVMKYLPDEARKLKAEGHIPNDMKLNEADAGDDELGEAGADIEFQFDTKIDLSSI